MVVEDNELPESVEWALVRTCDEGALLLVKRRRSTFETGLGDVLSAAWDLSARNSMGLPQPLRTAV